MALTDTLLTLLTTHWAPLTILFIFIHLTLNHYHNSLHVHPAPFPASLTNLWRFFNVLNRSSQKTHISLHRRLGPIVRLGPNTLSFVSPRALKTIYGLNKGFVKSDFYIVQQAVVGGKRMASLFSTTDEGFHARFRRCVNGAFAMSALVQYEPFVDNTTKVFLDRTEELYASTIRNNDKDDSTSSDSEDDKKGSPCDFTRWLQFYAFDVIGEITYSSRHGFISENRDVDNIISSLTSLFLYVAPIGQMPWLDLLLLKNPVYLKLSQWGWLDSTSPVARFARARIAERMPELRIQLDSKSLLPTTSILQAQDGQERLEMGKGKQGQGQPDLLSKFLLASHKHPSIMTPTLVQTMATSMAFAGSETTAITLSSIFHNLLHHPPVLRALVGEISDFRFADTKTGLVTWHEAQKLGYLDAVVKESFRMHPAAGLPLERVVPDGGMDIAGTWVKGGTIVGCSAWVIHQDMEVFGEDADVFRPERWLVGEGVGLGGAEGDEGREEWEERERKRIRTMDGTMLQFGMGSRTCIGKNISLLEIYKVVPSLLRRFEISLHDPTQEWNLVNAWFIKQNNFHVDLKRRSVILGRDTA